LKTGETALARDCLWWGWCAEVAPAAFLGFFLAEDEEFALDAPPHDEAVYRLLAMLSPSRQLEISELS